MVKFQFSYLQAGTVNHTVKSYSSMKLAKSNPFIEKNYWCGRANGTILESN